VTGLDIAFCRLEFVGTLSVKCAFRFPPDASGDVMFVSKLRLIEVLNVADLQSESGVTDES